MTSPAKEERYHEDEKITTLESTEDEGDNQKASTAPPNATTSSASSTTNTTSSKMTTALVCKDIKSSAIVKYAAVQAPAHFLKLTRDTDLKLPPDNWLRETDQWQVLKGCWASTSSSSTMFKSLLMANDFPDCVGEVDVVSDAENIKKLLKMPYSKSHVSMMVHCVGKTLLLDDFDVHRHLLRMAKNEWAWLRKFFLEDVVQSLHQNANSVLGKNRSRGHLQHKNMLSKFLYYSIADVCDRMEATGECQTSPTRRKVPPSSATGNSSENGGGGGNNKSMAHSPTPPSKSTKGTGSASSSTRKPTSATAFEQHQWEDELEEEQGFFNKDHNCQRNVLWTFEDIRMLIGTDMPIFGGGVHPCVSLRLRDITKPINVLTGLDYWLDNLMCNVPEVMMCYHLNGIVQKYELIQTEDIPKLDNSKFSPIVIKDIAQNILSFLKSNATKAGHTYWLFKAKDGDVVKLYDLTSLCDSVRDEKEQNPYSTPVAMLLYRVARNMRTSLGRDKRRLSTMCTLLENCLTLLDHRRHPQVVTSARYLLSDIYVPNTTDLSSPSTPLESEDEEDEHEEREGADSPPTAEETISRPSTPEEARVDASSSMDVKALCLPEKSDGANHHHHDSDERKPLTSTAPASASLVERCRAALRHIEEGLACLELGNHDQRTNDEQTPRPSTVHEEVQKQAKPFQAIPLHYEPLSGGGSCRTPQKSSREYSDRSSAEQGNAENGSDLPLEASPTSELNCSLREGAHHETWQNVYRELLMHKASLVSYVMAHCSSDIRKYGEVLRYLEMAFCSYCAHGKIELVGHKQRTRDTSLIAYMLSLAGDAHFMLVQHANRIPECQDQYRKGVEHERILEYARGILNTECEFTWATEFHDKMEDNLMASIRCYQVALEKTQDAGHAHRLRKRYGNVKNEMGVFQMNQAHALFNSRGETSDEHIESLWRSSFDNLQTGAKIFEDIRDEANVALLNCNLGRLMRMRAICSGGAKEFSAKERNFCEKASWYYQRALRAVNDNKDYAAIRESILWDLSSTYFMTATLLQDYAPLSTRSQEDVEREINEIMVKALKHCDWETPGSRQPIYQYRAANIFHRLGSLHHHSYRTLNSEARKKQQQRALAESYLGRAANLFQLLEESSEFLKVQLERISLQELQLTNKQPVTGNKMKSCHAVLELILESVPTVEFIVREQEKSSVAKTASETPNSQTPNVAESDQSDPNKTTTSDLNNLLDLLQQRLQNVLLNAIKMAGSSSKVQKKGANPDTTPLANYKKMYGEALKLPMHSTTNSTDTINWKSLLDVLKSIQTTYNSF